MKVLFARIKLQNHCRAVRNMQGICFDKLSHIMIVLWWIILSNADITSQLVIVCIYLKEKITLRTMGNSNAFRQLCTFSIWFIQNYLLDTCNIKTLYTWKWSPHITIVTILTPHPPPPTPPPQYFIYALWSWVYIMGSEMQPMPPSYARGR